MWNMAISKTLAFQQMAAPRLIQRAGTPENRKPLGQDRGLTFSSSKDTAGTATPLAFFGTEALKQPKMEVNTLIAHMFEKASTVVRRLFLMGATQVQNTPKPKEWQA